MFNHYQTKFDLNPHIVSCLQDASFYAEISRHIPKISTDSIPTLAIGYNKDNRELVFGYNPDFCSKLTNEQIRSVIIHEFLHIILGHIILRMKSNAPLWNIATDCAINSIIVDNNGSKNLKLLPEGVIIPGVPFMAPGDRALTKQEELALKRSQFIEQLPSLRSSEFYYNALQDSEEFNNDKGEGTGGEELDDHSFWSQIPEDQREQVEAKIKSIVSAAVKKADASNSWGNIPNELQRDIRRSISTIVDWRSVLRQFTGSLIRGKARKSMKRINRRFPYIHPGTTKGFNARLLLAIDQSGSVDDHMLSTFFGEARNLNKSILIDYLPFDSEAKVEDVVTWNRGACPAAKRARDGGTNFDAPTNVVNDPKNRGRWDGVIILTDGCAPKPGMSRIKRGWLLGKDQKLNFDINEIVIKLNDGQVRFGSCR